MAVFKAKKYWGWAILLLWGGAILALNLLQTTPYGVDEGAARSLLLNWSIVDRVANPIAFYGIPDFRILLLAPAAIYWTGSMMATKIWMLLLAFMAVVFLYRWSREQFSAEAALVSSGILLIAPLWLLQIEALSVGPLLVLMFGLGTWLDKKYEASGRVLSGWYFLQMVVVAAAVSLHPAGLAYPLALMLKWRKQADEIRRQKDMYIGTGLAILFVLLMWAGWTSLAWFNNPFTVLGQAVVAGFSIEPAGSWWLAMPLLLLFGGIALVCQKKITAHLFGSSLFFGGLLGAVAADFSWALLVVIFILFFGVPLLLDWNDRFAPQGLAGKRGVAMVVLFILGNAFLLADKTHRQIVLSEQLDNRNALIRLLSFELEANNATPENQELKLATQWPGLSMLILKRPVLPLPPESLSEEQMQAAVGDLDILIFAPEDGAHPHLIRAIANMTGQTKTLLQEDGGVVVGVVHPQK